MSSPIIVLFSSFFRFYPSDDRKRNLVIFTGQNKSTDFDADIPLATVWCCQKGAAYDTERVRYVGVLSHRTPENPPQFIFEIEARIPKYGLPKAYDALVPKMFCLVSIGLIPKKSKSMKLGIVHCEPFATFPDIESDILLDHWKRQAHIDKIKAQRMYLENK
jgi:hypothetical protein